MSDGQAPIGYHQGFVTAAVTTVGLSLGYLRFVAFDPAFGPWTVLGGCGGAIGTIGFLIQLWALRRAFLLKNMQMPIFSRTRSIWEAGIVVMLLSGAVLLLAELRR